MTAVALKKEDNTPTIPATAGLPLKPAPAMGDHHTQVECAFARVFNRYRSALRELAKV